MNTEWKILSDSIKESVVYADLPWQTILKSSYPGGLAAIYRENTPVSISSFPPTNESYSNPNHASASKVTFLITSHLSLHAELFLEWSCSLISITPISLNIFTILSEASHMHELEYDEALVGRWTRISTLKASDDETYFDAIASKIKGLLPESSQVNIQYHSNSCGRLKNGMYLMPTIQIDESYSRTVSYHISSFLETLNVKESLFPLGLVANEVSKHLCASSGRSSRRGSSREASLIMVDRDLDLCAAVRTPCNIGDLVYDKYFTTELIPDEKCIARDEVSDSNLPDVLFISDTLKVLEILCGEMERINHDSDEKEFKSFDSVIETLNEYRLKPSKIIKHGSSLSLISMISNSFNEYLVSA